MIYQARRAIGTAALASAVGSASPLASTAARAQASAFLAVAGDPQVDGVFIDPWSRGG